VFGCAGFVPPSPQVSRDPSAFCDREIDAQMERAAALQAEDPSATNVLWQRIEREILAQAPMVPTSNRRSVDFVAARVGHYEYHPQWGVLLDRLRVK
jgi:peptide/nickel transport system substrate-binding protein